MTAEERYVVILQNFYIPYLEENEWDIPHVWFQQHGATAHTARVSMNVVRETLAGRLISRKGDIVWPRSSPNPSLCDFFL